MTVYVLTYVDDKPYCLTKGDIYMRNEEAFILEDMLEDYIIEEYREPIYFNDENKTWFKTLKQAENHLDNLGFKLVKDYEDEWNIVKRRN